MTKKKKGKEEPVYQPVPPPLLLSQREEIVSDDKKYCHHVMRYLHHVQPREDLVKAREGRSRMTFDYLSGEDVMMMLNETFLRGWSQEVTSRETKVKERRDGKWQGISVIRLRFEAEMPPPLYHFCQENIGSKRSVGRDEIEVLEYLEKSAITDALKRCVKTISIPLGLFLYYEEEEWKTDAAREPESSPVQHHPVINGYLTREQLRPLWERIKMVVGNQDASKQAFKDVLLALGHSPQEVPAVHLNLVGTLSRLTNVDDMIATAQSEE